MEDTPLRRIRKDRGLSQAELAAAARTSQVQIDRLEKGQRKLTKEWATRLAGPLECHWAELIDDPAVARNKKEEALLGLFRGLSDDEQQAFLKVVDALAKPPAPADGDKKAKDG